MGAAPKSPAVSVVIPAWNAGRWLRETLASVFAQTIDDFEVIVVDDGSSDDSAAIAAAVAVEQAPRLTLIRQPNAGVSAARNRGIAAAKGEFIALLDNDDLWLPDKLGRQLALMRADPRIALVFCDYTPFDGQIPLNGFDRAPVLRRLQTQPLGDHGRLITDPAAAARLLDDLYCQIPSTWLLRKSAVDAVGGFDARLRSGGEDLNLALRLAASYPLAYDERSLLRRRERGDSLGKRSNLDYSYVCALDLLAGDARLGAALQAQIRRIVAQRSHHLVDALPASAAAQAAHLRRLAFRFAGALPPLQMLKLRCKAAAGWLSHGGGGRTRTSS